MPTDIPFILANNTACTRDFQAVKMRETSVEIRKYQELTAATNRFQYVVHILLLVQLVIDDPPTESIDVVSPVY